LEDISRGFLGRGDASISEDTAVSIFTLTMTGILPYHYTTL